MATGPIVENFDDLVTNSGLTYSDLEKVEIDFLGETNTYKGPDPVSTLALLSKKNTNLQALTADMKKLITFVCLRGTNIEKAIMRMKPEGRKELEALRQKYDIKKGRGGRDVITLSGIMAAFPHLAAMTMTNPSFRVVGMELHMPLRGLCFASGASLIPNAPEWQSLYNLWRAWNNTFTAVIRASQSPNVDYAEISRQSTYTSTDARLKILTSLGISPNCVTSLDVQVQRSVWENYNSHVPGHFATEKEFWECVRGTANFPKQVP